MSTPPTQATPDAPSTPPALDATCCDTMPTSQSRDGRRVFLETFGCQMNVLDSELVTSQLRGLGYRFVKDWKQADVVLYNTCSVRERAEQKVWSRIGEVGVHKKENPEAAGMVLGVIGCMAEREGGDMVRKHPHVDLLCGPGELDKVPMLIDNVVKTNIENRFGRRSYQSALQGNTHRRSATLAAAEDQLELLDLSRAFNPSLNDSVDGDDGAGSSGEERGGGMDPENAVQAPRRSAYVRITRGCNKFCTYCVVPFTRGAEVHRPPMHIIDEVKRLADAGVVEVTLLGQTVNHYHYDQSAAVTVNGVQQPQVGEIVKNKPGAAQAMSVGSSTSSVDAGETWGGGRVSFADLLYRIHEAVPHLPRLRFVTSFPRDFGDDILAVMRDCPRICRYLHLPVQSGSDRLLKAMNRDYTVAGFMELLERARTFLPDVQIASDIICGFPTETQADHEATADLLRQAQFKNCFIFKYSPRPGTAAIDRFEDDVSDTEKKRRNNELLAIQSDVSALVHREQVGKTVRVFVESISARSRRNANTAAPNVTLGWQRDQEITQLSGRTDGDLIVMFDGDPSLVGSLVDVQVDRSAPLALFGQMVEQAVSV